MISNTNAFATNSSTGEYASVRRENSHVLPVFFDVDVSLLLRNHEVGGWAFLRKEKKRPRFELHHLLECGRCNFAREEVSSIGRLSHCDDIQLNRNFPLATSIDARCETSYADGGLSCKRFCAHPDREEKEHSVSRWKSGDDYWCEGGKIRIYLRRQAIIKTREASMIVKGC